MHKEQVERGGGSVWDAPGKMKGSHRRVKHRSDRRVRVSFVCLALLV